MSLKTLVWLATPALLVLGTLWLIGRLRQARLARIVDHAVRDSIELRLRTMADRMRHRREQRTSQGKRRGWFEAKMEARVARHARLAEDLADRLVTMLAHEDAGDSRAEIRALRRLIDHHLYRAEVSENALIALEPVTRAKLRKVGGRIHEFWRTTVQSEPGSSAGRLFARSRQSSLGQGQHGSGGVRAKASGSDQQDAQAQPSSGTTLHEHVRTAVARAESAVWTQADALQSVRAGTNAADNDAKSGASRSSQGAGVGPERFKPIWLDLEPAAGEVGEVGQSQPQADASSARVA